MVKRKRKKLKKIIQLKAELGDNLFVLLCIANSLDIDMTESFNETMEKFNTRDKIVLNVNKYKQEEDRFS